MYEFLSLLEEAQRTKQFEFMRLTVPKRFPVTLIDLTNNKQ